MNEIESYNFYERYPGILMHELWLQLLTRLRRRFHPFPRSLEPGFISRIATKRQVSKVVRRPSLAVNSNPHKGYHPSRVM